MLLKTLIASMLLTAYCAVALADDYELRPPHKQEMPQGLTVTKDTVEQLDFENEQAYKCYNAKQYLEVGQLVIDYRWFWENSFRVSAVLVKYESMIGKYELEIKILKDTNKQLDESRKFAVSLFKEERKTKEKRRFKAELTMWIAIGIALAEGILFSIMYATKE